MEHPFILLLLLIDSFFCFIPIRNICFEFSDPDIIMETAVPVSSRLRLIYCLVFEEASIF